MLNHKFNSAEKQYRAASAAFLKTEEAFQKLDDEERELYAPNTPLTKEEKVSRQNEIDQKRAVVTMQVAIAEEKKRMATQAMDEALAKITNTTTAATKPAQKAKPANTGNIHIPRLNLSGISRAGETDPQPSPLSQRQDAKLAENQKKTETVDPKKISVENNHAPLNSQKNATCSYRCGCINMRLLGGFMVALGVMAVAIAFILLNASSGGALGVTIAVAGFVMGFAGVGLFSRALNTSREKPPLPENRPAVPGDGAFV